MQVTGKHLPSQALQIQRVDAIPKPAPGSGRPKLMSAYGAQIQWFGSRSQADGAIPLVVVSGDQDCCCHLFTGVGASAVQIFICVDTDPASALPTARRIVAAFRWLVAQGISPDTITITSCPRCAAPAAEAARLLRHAGDGLVSDLVVLGTCDRKVAPLPASAPRSAGAASLASDESVAPQPLSR